MTMSALPYFATDCWVTVLPEPNGPGIAAVPPIVRGNSTSRMRMPVRNAVAGSSLRATGRGCFTGHGWYIFRSVPSSRVTTTSWTVYSPSGLADATLPAIPGGTRTLGVNGAAGAVTTTLPGC